MPVPAPSSLLQIEVMEGELRAAREAARKSPARTTRDLVERLKNDLATKEKQYKVCVCMCVFLWYICVCLGICLCTGSIMCIGVWVEFYCRLSVLLLSK